MRSKDSLLAESCRNYAEAVRSAVDWVEGNKDLVRGEYEILLAELRKSIRALRKCENSAPRKMCVGVFGPSQSGKSYLISALAKDSEGNLTVGFGGKKYDFIEDINPPGGKESTGLVTRFTMDRPSNSPQGYPVKLRLLSEVDIIKIIANTYYSDCEHAEKPRPEAISDALDQLGRKRTGHPAGSMSVDDLEELRAYVHTSFGTKPRPQVLDTVYWDRAIAMARDLSPDDRVRLFALIWDEVERFTALYRRLYEALAKLDFPSEAYCPVEALVPKDNSIIDVAALKGLGEDSPEGIEVVNAQGRKARLTRSELTALTAEITVPMLSRPAEFFEYTDLLDFPGYRSRMKSKDIRQQIEDEGALENFFLRGKVAYLFERYNDERELTSMLLCIGPGNQEVQDLPWVIDNWMRATHGETPAKRLGADMALFFILTKFDMEFEKKKGASTTESRWKIRLQSSLLDFFGKQHQWPTRWDGVRAFNNLFFLRNPNVKCEAVFEYSGLRETGIRAAQKADLEKLKKDFLDTKEVRDHFAEPERAWEAAMSLNDGGVQYLREKLSPLCNPDLKRTQIQKEMNEILGRLDAKLRAYFQSDDKAEERKKKETLAKQLAVILAKVAQAQRFGEFLRKLQINDYELYDLHFQVESAVRNSQEQSPTGDITAPPTLVGVRVSGENLLEDFADLDVEEPSQVGPSEIAGTAVDEKLNLPRDEAEYFASLIEKNWIERLGQTADNQYYQAYFGFPAYDFGHFKHEIVKGAHRLGLKNQIEEAIRKASRYQNIRREKLIWKEVSVATHIINSYINWLSFDPRQTGEKQRIVNFGGKERELFRPPAPVGKIPQISEDQTSFDAQYYRDWLGAFRILVMRNVDFDGQQTVNLEQNARLGQILEKFKPQATA